MTGQRDARGRFLKGSGPPVQKPARSTGLRQVKPGPYPQAPSTPNPPEGSRHEHDVSLERDRVRIGVTRYAIMDRGDCRVCGGPILRAAGEWLHRAYFESKTVFSHAARLRR